MIELVVSVFILAFIYLGFRDGLAKTLGSIIMIFLALFLSSAAIAGLATIAGEFSNPKSLVTIVFFFIIWLALYIALHLLIKLILKVVIQVTVLGPLDQVGGLLLGAVRGLLIAGIVLQVFLSFPITDKTRQAVLAAMPAKFSIATFQWLYPAAEKMQPYIENLIKMEKKSGVMENMSLPGSITEEVQKKIEDNVPALQKETQKQEERLRQLLEDNNLKPTAPSGRPQ
jgi:uncharacterized membrane protein required for colicin V production